MACWRRSRVEKRAGSQEGRPARIARAVFGGGSGVGVRVGAGVSAVPVPGSVPVPVPGPVPGPVPVPVPGPVPVPVPDSRERGGVEGVMPGGRTRPAGATTHFSLRWGAGMPSAPGEGHDALDTS
jgi:hypothetical protein